jgi:hypothetical protein
MVADSEERVGGCADEVPTLLLWVGESDGGAGKGRSASDRGHGYS